MSGCCDENTKIDASASDCCCSAKRNILFYACSGGANVAEIADRAARELMFSGDGTMFCLAGLGAGIDGMIQTARDADMNVVIDGCPMECARKTFDRAGVSDYTPLLVTELGIEKVKGVPATEEQVDRIVAKVREIIA